MLESCIQLWHDACNSKGQNEAKGSKLKTKN
jgi:hypothetical protein